MGLGKKISRINDFLGKRTSLYTATLIVWLATGLWHGPEWRYVLWGLLNGIIMCVSAELTPLYDRLNRMIGWKTGGFFHRSFAVIRTFAIMSLLRVFDLSFEGIRMALSIYKRILLRPGMIYADRLEELGLPMEELAVALAGIAILFVISLLERKKSIYDRLMERAAVFRWVFCTACVAVVIIFGCYGLGYDSADFIYMQF